MASKAHAVQTQIVRAPFEKRHASGQLQGPNHGGQITAKELALAGKLRILGITSKTRSASSPQWPTMQELGQKDFEFQNWFGVIVSVKTPPAIVKKLNTALLEVLAQADIRQRLTQDGSEIVGNSSEEFTAFLTADAQKWKSLVGAMALRGD